MVIIAALDGTYQRQPFTSVLALLALAETVEKLHAVCDGCGADAGFTQRLGCENAVKVGQRRLIDSLPVSTELRPLFHAL